MSDGRPHARGARREPSAAGASDEAVPFDRWLAYGLAPDDHDRAAGRVLADAWRDRRRALDRAVASGTTPAERRRRLWRWAPLMVVAIAVVAVVSWPTPTVVDDAALAGAYLEAMGTLPSGAP